MKLSSPISFGKTNMASRKPRQTSVSKAMTESVIAPLREVNQFFILFTSVSDRDSGARHFKSAWHL